jgi:hypothetical protein
MATKNDLGKNRLELIDPIIIEEIAKVIRFKKPCDISDELTLYGNTIFHLNSWRRGEDIYESSNLLHLSHAAYNVCMMIELSSKDSKDKIILDESPNNYALIPSSFFKELGQVLTFGAKKYAAFNWCAGSGLDSLRLYGATLRHLIAYHEGEILDPESGLLHLSHVACELMFLLYFQVTGKGDDTRPHLVSGVNDIK